MQPNLSRRTVLAGGVATLLPIRVRAGDAAHRLTILHANDIHSRHDPVDDRALNCPFDAAHPSCLGGTARLAGSLALARKAAEAACDNGPPIEEVVAKALTGEDPPQGRAGGRIMAAP